MGQPDCSMGQLVRQNVSAGCNADYPTLWCRPLGRACRVGWIVRWAGDHWGDVGGQKDLSPHTDHCVGESS